MPSVNPPWKTITDLHAAATATHLRKTPLVMAGVLVVVSTIVFLIVLNSMWHTLRDESGSARYDVLTGQQIQLSEMALMDKDTAYLAITVTGLNEETGILTLRISGHRVCTECPPVTLQLFSLDGDPADWWGLPPSQMVKL
ncbi:MAG: hypothetical protein ACR2J8_00970, partial [Thermomicrobiales bacterium]